MPHSPATVYLEAFCYSLQPKVCAGCPARACEHVECMRGACMALEPAQAVGHWLSGIAILLTKCPEWGFHLCPLQE